MNDKTLPKIMQDGDIKALVDANRDMFPHGVFELTEAFKEYLIGKLAQGLTVKEIRKELSINVYKLYRIINSDINFAMLCNEIRSECLEELSDELISIPDEYASVERATLKSNNIKWLLSKRLPKKYGDRLQVDVSVIDLNEAIESARNRSDIIETQRINRAIINGSNDDDLW